MQPSTFEVRLLVRVGLALWLLAGLSEVWEVLALQPPDSPLHAGVLAGPIGQLASHAFAHGTLALLLGLSWPALAPKRGLFLLSLLLGGALLQLGAMAYAASEGMLAVQLLDPRPDARFVLYLRALGHLLTLAALALALSCALRTQRANKPAS